PRQRTLMRAPEMDADTDDGEVDADVDPVAIAVAAPDGEADGDDTADSITLELAFSGNTPTPPLQAETSEDIAELDNSKPFKVKDITRNIRKAVVANSLAELRLKVTAKFQRTQPAIHLDCDGTEIDDEEYFSTLEPNAELIAVFPGEQWRDPSDYNANMRRSSLDAQRLRKLVGKLQQNLINDADLDTLSNMDPNSLVDITGRELKDSDYCIQSEAARRSTELSC
ncbi:Drep-3, partial [Drosophila busckii]